MTDLPPDSEPRKRYSMNFNGPSWLMFLIGILIVLAILALVGVTVDVR